MVCFSKKFLSLTFLLIVILLTGVVFFNLNNSQNINSKAATIVCKTGVNSFSVDTPCRGGYRYMTFACYDGFSRREGSPSSCKSSSIWFSYAKEYCKNRSNCSAPTPIRPTIWPTPQVTGIPTPPPISPFPTTQISSIPTPTPTQSPPLGCYYKLICPTPTLVGPTIWPTTQVTRIPTPTPTARITI